MAQGKDTFLSPQGMGLNLVEVVEGGSLPWG